jgi:hypothetical protein
MSCAIYIDCFFFFLQGIDDFKLTCGLEINVTNTAVIDLM